MSKSELLDSAKKIENTVRALLEKTGELQTEVSNSLQAAKRFESRLISKERAEKAERMEREKTERLMEYLNSTDQHGVYVSDRDLPTSKTDTEDEERSYENDGASNIGSAAPENGAAEKTIATEGNSVAIETADAVQVVDIVHEEIGSSKPELESPLGSEPGITGADEGAMASARPDEMHAPEQPIDKTSRVDANAKADMTEVRKANNSTETTPRSSDRDEAGNGRELAHDRVQRNQNRDDSKLAERKPRTERTDRTGRTERFDRTERSDRVDRHERTEHSAQIDRSERPDRAAVDRRDGRNSSERSFGERRSADGAQRGDRQQRGDRFQRGDFNQRGAGGQRMGMDKDKDGGRGGDFSGRQGNRQQSGRTTQRRQNADAPVIVPKENRSPDNRNTYVRTFDNEKKVKNKKTIMKETAPSANNWDDEGSSYRKRRTVKQQETHRPEPVVIDKAVITTDTITVRDFSEKIGKPAAEIIKKLFMMGVIANINQDIDFDTCELIAMDYNIELEHQVAKTYEEAMQEVAEEADTEESLVARPPIVTIMGHVDHGKTSLLDAIRNSSITAGEAGGITQHIGAYTVNCKGRTITFIDTPGHEAFTSMRARGAQVTDVVILVVAADDGIMPQTVEAINHSKAAEVPIIVAINKMDKPEADPERVKQQLTEHGLVPDDWGGDTICVPVSAKKQINLDGLLEMVLLQADILELKANPNRAAKGTIIEAQLDKGRGPVATVLVQNGTLKVGDPIVAGIAYGKVRAMTDDKGRNVKTAGPSQPVEVLGFNEVPSAGDIMNVAEVSKKVAEERRNKIKAEQLKSFAKVSLEDLFSHIAEGEIKTLNIVIKADVHGSVEAVKQALEKLSNDEVRVKCIHGAVGAISESDVMFASASNAIVIGFNVRPDSGARSLAEQEKVDVRTYRIIYQAIEDVENAMKGMFKPVYKEVHLGTVSVRETFRVSGIGTIAGAYVQDGKVQRSALVRVVRDGIVIHEGKIASLRRFKDDVREVAAGYECGIGIEDFNDINEGDSIEAYIMEEVKR